MPTRLEVMEQVITCTRCVLHTEASAPVPFSGPTDARIVVLGEAPGKQEDEQGAPFVGQAGQLIRGMLKKIGFDPDSVAFVNTASCWPSVTRTPQAEHVEACAVNKRAQLAVLTEAKYVLVLGGVALNAEHPGLKISKVHGRIWLRDGRTWFVSYHPAAALRNRIYERSLEEDLQAFATVVEGADPVELVPEKCVLCSDYISWIDDELMGWCPAHAPVEYHERQAELEAEVRSIRAGA